MSGKRSLPSVWAWRGALFASVAAGSLVLLAALGAWLMFMPSEDDGGTAGRSPGSGSTLVTPSRSAEAAKDVLIKRDVPRAEPPGPLLAAAPPSASSDGPSLRSAAPGRAAGEPGSSSAPSAVTSRPPSPSPTLRPTPRPGPSATGPGSGDGDGDGSDPGSPTPTVTPTVTPTDTPPGRGRPCPDPPGAGKRDEAERPPVVNPGKSSETGARRCGRPPDPPPGRGRHLGIEKRSNP